MAKASADARSTARSRRRRARESDLAAGQFEPPCPICGQPLATALVGEDAPLDPRNAYASSKVAQEFYCSNWARVTGGSVAAHALSQRLRSRHAARHALCRRRRDLHLGACAAAKRRRCSRTADSAATSSTCATSPRRRCWPARSHQSGVRAFNVGSGTPRTVGEMAQALAHR